MMLHLLPPCPSPAPLTLYLARLLLRPDITPRPLRESNIGLLRNWAALSSLSSLSRVEHNWDREVLLRNQKRSVILTNKFYIRPAGLHEAWAAGCTEQVAVPLVLVLAVICCCLRMRQSEACPRTVHAALPAQAEAIEASLSGQHQRDLRGQ